MKHADGFPCEGSSNGPFPTGAVRTLGKCLPYSIRALKRRQPSSHAYSTPTPTPGLHFILMIESGWNLQDPCAYKISCSLTPPFPSPPRAWANPPKASQTVPPALGQERGPPFPGKGKPCPWQAASLSTAAPGQPVRRRAELQPDTVHPGNEPLF